MAIEITKEGRPILTLEILGLEDSDDWLQAYTHFEDFGFVVDFKFSMRLNELYSFLEQLKTLYKNLAGLAILSSIEDNIHLTFSTDGLGHIVIKGILRHPQQYDLETSFTIATDQTSLPTLINSCQEVINQYSLK